MSDLILLNLEPSLFTLANATPFIAAAVIFGSLIFFGLLFFFISRYKRCPSNRVLVIYGKVGGARAARCIHGGAAFVLPVVQDFGFLSLEPVTIDIDLMGALSFKNIRVNVPSTFTIGVSTDAEIMVNAAERLLGLSENQIGAQAQDIIIGQLRLVIATMTIEEINQDREKFLEQINQNVNIELNKIGLEVINVNIRDITDESGYIEAIGKKAAALAVQAAKVDVAEAEKGGAIGEAKENREKEVIVAREQAVAAEGQKEAERNKRIALARLEAEGATGEAASEREKDVAIAREAATTAQGQKEAERSKRIALAQYESEAVSGENESKATIAERNAALAEAEAEAQRRTEVARAQANKLILEAQRMEEQAQLEKDQIVQEEISKRRLEIAAEADAEKNRRIARGEADAILAKYQAEADGTRQVLEAKAQGYRSLVESCRTQPDLAATLLMIEKLPEIVEEQVKAIANLKIDKITVWDNASGGKSGKPGTTANFLSSMIGSLPAVHELAEQAGVELPRFLGSLKSQTPEHQDAEQGTENLPDDNQAPQNPGSV